ncbi:MAG: metal ABC transporter permease [Desulfobacteraceae bacterium]|nr:MAG: metal ABC transporter permease [Desulfobacteraceae bacterium]
MIDIFQFEFMRNALLAGLLVSFICGVMGTLAVANRMVFLSGGIAHAAYGGIGLAFLLRWPYLLGTFGFSLLAAIVMAAASMNIKHRADAVIGAVWAVGMAMGIVFIDLSPGYPADLMSYLFGSILAVPQSDLWVMAAAALVMTAVVLLYYSDFLALSYDEEFARIRRVPVKRLYYLLVCLLALAVVLTIRVVGLILVIALLTIPPFIAEKFTRSLLQMMGWSCVLSAAFTLIGLIAAFYLNLTAGACIILAAGTGFFISLAAERVFTRSPAQDPESAHS